MEVMRVQSFRAQRPTGQERQRKTPTMNSFLVWGLGCSKDGGWECCQEVEQVGSS